MTGNWLHTHQLMPKNTKNTWGGGVSGCALIRETPQRRLSHEEWQGNGPTKKRERGRRTEREGEGRKRRKGKDEVVVEEEEKEKGENRLFKSKVATVTFSKNPHHKRDIYLWDLPTKFCKTLTQLEKNQMSEIVREHTHTRLFQGVQWGLKFAFPILLPRALKKQNLKKKNVLCTQKQKCGALLEEGFDLDPEPS